MASQSTLAKLKLGDLNVGDTGFGGANIWGSLFNCDPKSLSTLMEEGLPQ